MERFMGLQTLEGFNRKNTYNEAMQGLEDHFRLSYREVDEVFPLISKTAVEIVNFKQGKHLKELNSYSKIKIVLEL